MISQTLIFQKKVIHSNLVEKLRYGENPHQQSAIYSQSESLEFKNTWKTIKLQ